LSRAASTPDAFPPHLILFVPTNEPRHRSRRARTHVPPRQRHFPVAHERLPPDDRTKRSSSVNRSFRPRTKHGQRRADPLVSIVLRSQPTVRIARTLSRRAHRWDLFQPRITRVFAERSLQSLRAECLRDAASLHWIRILSAYRQPPRALVCA